MWTLKYTRHGREYDKTLTTLEQIIANMTMINKMKWELISIIKSC